VAYDDWPEEFQEVWDTLERADAFEGKSASEIEYAEFMFEEGWMTYEDEKVHVSDIDYARQEFWDTIGLEYEDEFDWEGWREAMGYDLWVSVPVPKPSPVIGSKPGYGRRPSVPPTASNTTLIGGSITPIIENGLTKRGGHGSQRITKTLIPGWRLDRLSVGMEKVTLMRLVFITICYSVVAMISMSLFLALIWVLWNVLSTFLLLSQTILTLFM
jgi:hypothetical protein